VKKRILIVLNYYYPHLSGLSEYARLAAEAMTSHFEVTVLTGRHSPFLKEKENIQGVRVIRANPLLFLHKAYLSLDLFLSYRKLIAQTDLVHLHLPMLEAGLLAWLTPSTVPVLCTYHCDVAPRGGIDPGLKGEVSLSSMIDSIATRAVHISARLCFSKAKKIMVNSFDYANGSPTLKGFESKWLELFPPSHEFPVPTKSSVESFAEGPLTNSKPSSLKSPNVSLLPEFHIGFLGRFVFEKGIHVLLKAIPKILESFPSARFILAGNYDSVAGGSIYSELKDHITALQNNIELLGPLSQEQLAGFYQSLDLFVLPSTNSYESFGLVQIEAMKNGIEVVASDMRGVRVPILLTGNGTLVPPGNSDRLADAVIKHLEMKLTPSEHGVRQHLAEQHTRRPDPAIAAKAQAIFSNAQCFSRLKSVYEAS